VIRVLHIEPQAPIRMLTRVNLEHEGMQVIEAADGLTGLQLAKGEQPDLILLNVLLHPGAAPGFRWPRNHADEPVGWQVAWELRKDPETWAIPIVFFTARVGLKDRVRGFDLGAVDYIAQPFDPTELAPRLRGLLERLERDGWDEWHELRRENLILDVLARTERRQDSTKIEGVSPDVRECDRGLRRHRGALCRRLGT
jgi:DNA-binding response OmpR family regulator